MCLARELTIYICCFRAFPEDGSVPLLVRRAMPWAGFFPFQNTGCEVQPHKQTNKQTKDLHLENCKSFILNYSVGEFKSSRQVLVILVAILRIISRRNLANCSSCPWVCARVHMLGGRLSPWEQKENERPLCSPWPFMGGSAGSTVSVQGPETDSLDRNETWRHHENGEKEREKAKKETAFKRTF